MLKIKILKLLFCSKVALLFSKLRKIIKYNLSLPFSYWLSYCPGVCDLISKQCKLQTLHMQRNHELLDKFSFHFNLFHSPFLLSRYILYCTWSFKIPSCLDFVQAEIYFAFQGVKTPNLQILPSCKPNLDCCLVLITRSMDPYWDIWCFTPVSLTV